MISKGQALLINIGLGLLVIGLGLIVVNQAISYYSSSKLLLSPCELCAQENIRVSQCLEQDNINYIKLNLTLPSSLPVKYK